MGTSEIIEYEGKEYIRVTSVLKYYSGLDAIPKYIVEAAALRGRMVHEICEDIMRGVKNPIIPEKYEGYIRSFRKWWDQGHEIEAIEQRYFDDQLEISGAIDIIEKKEKDGFAIVDIKTSYKPSSTWILQGSAYAYLARIKGKYEITSIEFLHLDKFGGAPTLYIYPDVFSVYLHALKVYKFFKGFNHDSVNKKRIRKSTRTP